MVIVLRGISQGAMVLGAIVRRGELYRGNCLGGISSGAVIWEEITQGAKVQRRIVLRGSLLGAIVLGKCPDTIRNVFISNELLFLKRASAVFI